MFAHNDTKSVRAPTNFDLCFWLRVCHKFDIFVGRDSIYKLKSVVAADLTNEEIRVSRRFLAGGVHGAPSGRYGRIVTMAPGLAFTIIQLDGSGWWMVEWKLGGSG